MSKITLIETYSVPKAITPIRLQEYGVGIFKSVPTKSGLKKAIKKGLVKVNNKIANTALFIQGGEIIELFQQNEIPKALDKLRFPLEVIYEDDFLAIVMKPPGVIVSGNTFVTIYNALPQNLITSTQADTIRPKPVHRLDYPTSGLLVVGKTSTATRALYQLFEEKKVVKTYYAITIGNISKTGIIDTLIDGKKAISEYTTQQSVVSKRFQYLNLVELKPITGRRHQLRKHLFSIGTPILGDKDYYLENLLLKGKGLYLHAKTIAFTHPITQEQLYFNTELPKKFLKIFPKTE